MQRTSSIKRILLTGSMLCGLILCCCLLPAQKDAPDYVRREFDPVKLEKFRKDPDFKYERQEGNKLESEEYADRIRGGQGKTGGERPFRNYNPGGATSITGAGQVIMWILIVLAGVALIYFIANAGIKFGKKKTEPEEEDAGADPLEEDIHELEFDPLIRDAIARKQYRLAIRLLYLRTLRLLSEARMIQWRREKTNMEYLFELKAQELRNDFSDLTLLFEQCWYGELLPDAPVFESAVDSFRAFEQQIPEPEA